MIHIIGVYIIYLYFLFSPLYETVTTDYFYFYSLRGKRCETTVGRFSCPDRPAVCSSYTYTCRIPTRVCTHIHISRTTSERSHAKLTRGQHIHIHIYIIYIYKSIYVYNMQCTHKREEIKYNFKKKKSFFSIPQTRTWKQRFHTFQSNFWFIATFFCAFL